MKHFSALQFQLVMLLSDGFCHSGNALGERLGVTRTAVWKQISQLIAIGVPISRLPQQGYQLSKPYIPLQEALILKHLNLSFAKPPISLQVFAELDSTNRFLKEASSKNGFSVCCAEKQTAGRGRFGRHWVSPFGENIYLSIRWKLNCCLSKLSGLSLIVSLAVLTSLRKAGIQEDIRIKWPNDLLWNHKKLSGVLIEVTAEANGAAEVIIGIGLNVNTDTQMNALIDRPWCSLHEITGKIHDRNALTAELLNTVDSYLGLFLQQGFDVFHKQWQEVDYLDGQHITVSQSQGLLSGYANGVTNEGQLCLIDTVGKEHYLSSGDTSLAR